MDKIRFKKAMTRHGARKPAPALKAELVDGEQHIIRVKFCSFGTVDSDGDMLMKGCIGKSIRERGPESATHRKIQFLWQHEVKNPIGRILSIEERDDGGYATVQLSDFDAVPDARRAWAQLNEGVLDQFSIGYQYVWDKCDYDPDLDCLVVKEIILHEVSVVTFGANEHTAYLGDGKAFDEMIECIKALQDVAPDEYEPLRNRILEALKAEPAVQPLTSGCSVFAKIGQSSGTF